MAEGGRTVLLQAVIILSVATLAMGFRRVPLQTGSCVGVAPRCDIQSTPAGCTTKPGCFWSSTPGSASYYTGTCTGSAKPCYTILTESSCKVTGYCIWSASGGTTPSTTPAATTAAITPAPTTKPTPAATAAATKSPSPSAAKPSAPAPTQMVAAPAPAPGNYSDFSMAEDGIQLALISGYEDLPGVTGFGTVSDYINLYGNGTFKRHLCRLTAAGFHSQTNSTGEWAIQDNQLLLQTTQCTPNVRSIFCREGEELAVGEKVYELYELECEDGPCLEILGMDEDNFFSGPYRLYDISSPWEFCAA